MTQSTKLRRRTSVIPLGCQGRLSTARADPTGVGHTGARRQATILPTAVLPREPTVVGALLTQPRETSLVAEVLTQPRTPTAVVEVLTQPRTTRGGDIVVRIPHRLLFTDG